MRYTDTGRASFVIIYSNKRLPTVNVWRNPESGTESNSPHGCCLRACAPLALCLWCTLLLGRSRPCCPIAACNNSVRLLAEPTIHACM